MLRTLIFSATAMIAIGAAPAMAQSMGAPALRAAGVAGEQADGYMGAVPNGGINDAQKRAMDQVNIQRRSDFTAKAAATGVTVQQFAQFTACEIFSKSVKAGNWYRDENGNWHKATGPAPLPSWCPK